MSKSTHKILKLFKDKEIYLAIFDTQYDITSTMIRMQEFYESDSPKFRGKLFTLDDYMDFYAKKHDGKFSYFTDWNGFNLPSNVINEWVSGIDKSDEHEFRDKEIKFLDTLFGTLETHVDNKWYLIAVSTQCRWDTLRHEIAHALWYLDPSYKTNATVLINALPKYHRDIMIEFLTIKGYGKNVLFDELNAFMSTAGPRLDRLVWDKIKTHKLYESVDNEFELYPQQTAFSQLFRERANIQKIPKAIKNIYGM